MSQHGLNSPETAVAPDHRVVATAEPASRPFEVLGVSFTLCGFTEAVARVRDMIASGRPHHLVLANVHTVNHAWEDAAYRSVLQRANLVLRDGVGVEFAAKLRGADPGYNFVGTDFVPDLLVALGPKPVRVFLFGAQPGVAERAGCVLERRAPHVRIVGTAPGFGAFARVQAQVAAARPDVLLVALGNPLQESWIDQHQAALGVPVAMGVGALFDYLAGRVRRAPRWVQRARGEWLFRLVVEPRRLWRRYVVGNPRFLWRVVLTGRKERS
jgi:exopolysaccharide biosynthesis WecB/TagA/CpsF family protein